MYRTYMARRYVKALTPEKRSMFEEKVLAEQLFKGKSACDFSFVIMYTNRWLHKWLVTKK